MRIVDHLDHEDAGRHPEQVLAVVVDKLAADLEDTALNHPPLRPSVCRETRRAGSSASPLGGVATGPTHATSPVFIFDEDEHVPPVLLGPGGDYVRSHSPTPWTSAQTMCVAVVAIIVALAAFAFLAIGRVK